jgi:hypothetical protein
MRHKKECQWSRKWVERAKQRNSEAPTRKYYKNTNNNKKNSANLSTRCFAVDANFAHSKYDGLQPPCTAVPAAIFAPALMLNARLVRSVRVEGSRLEGT